MKYFLVTLLLCMDVLYGSGLSKNSQLQPGEKFMIRGTVHGMSSGWVYFSRPDSTGYIFAFRDSAKVINEHFEFSCKMDQSVKLIMGLRFNKTIAFGSVLFPGKGTLTIECDKDHLSDLKARGTNEQEEFNQFTEKHRPIFLAGNTAYGAKLRAESRHNKKAVDSLENLFSIYKNQTSVIIIEQVKAHPNSVVSAYLVDEYLAKQPDAAVLQPLYDVFSENVKHSLYGKNVWKALQAGNRTVIGVKAPGFIIADKNRNKISLDAFKGKYTLIDFWASWCGPCRAENPKVLEAYNNYKNKGFDVLSVSLDDNKTNWLKAVGEDKLPWTQVCDLKGTNSEVKKNYGIKMIPMNYLLDKEGRIIAKNLRGEALQRKLAEVLK